MMWLIDPARESFQAILRRADASTTAFCDGFYIFLSSHSPVMAVAGGSLGWVALLPGLAGLDLEEEAPQLFRATGLEFGPGELKVWHGRDMDGPQHSIVLDANRRAGESWRHKSSEGKHKPDPNKVVSTWLTVMGHDPSHVDLFEAALYVPAGLAPDAAVYRRLTMDGTVTDEIEARRRALESSNGYGLCVSLPIRSGVRQTAVMVDYFQIDTGAGNHPIGSGGLSPVKGAPDYVVIMFREI